MINCPHYQAEHCHSCQWLNLPYSEQLKQKQQHLLAQLSSLNLAQTLWLEPFQSEQIAFRNKAKMAISNSVERPILGIVNQQNQGIDLTDCPLYPAQFSTIFPILKDFIARAGLVPYNIEKQKGELKYILLTESYSSKELLIRFVLRSENKLALMRRELARLLAKLPQLKVVTANIQPQHAAILEGEKEIFLTEQKVLEDCFNEIPLFIRPQGFFQTNPEVAQGLYAQAQQWVENLPIKRLWDLFCGVGGFGLHCAKVISQHNPDVELTGIEISASAIESAKLAAQKLELSNVKFQSLDAATFALNEHTKPELVIVNPPRRGIGKALAEYLNQMQPHFILYSSCNSVTMGKDLTYLNNYQLDKIRLFDMFPHTSHYEVLTLLKLKK